MGTFCRGLLVVTMIGWFGDPAQAEWQNALKPQESPAGQVTVASSGQPQAWIQIPGQPTPQETNAAAELRHWLREMTGATLEITSAQAPGNYIGIRNLWVAN